MGTGYNRTDTTNNIATGNIINASDLDAEYDAIDAAFDETTGHDHGGASGNGAPITKVGPAQDVVVSTSSVTPKTTATLDLGTPLLKFKDLNLSGNVAIGGTVGNTTYTGTIISDNTTDSTSITSGAIQTDGGLGVAKALWVGGLTNIAGAITLQSNLTFTGTSNRIRGDFSNGTQTNRVLFQTSTANSATILGVIPSGTSVTSRHFLYNSSDADNAGIGILGMTSTKLDISTSISGTGTNLPITITTNNIERLRVFVSGGVSIGNTTDPGAGALSVTGTVTTAANLQLGGDYTTSALLVGSNSALIGRKASDGSLLIASGQTAIEFAANNGGSFTRFGTMAQATGLFAYSFQIQCGNDYPFSSYQIGNVGSYLGRDGADGSTKLYTAQAGIRFGSGATEWARVEAGNFSVGTTTASGRLNSYSPNSTSGYFQSGNNNGGFGSVSTITSVNRGDNGGGSQTGYCFYATSPYDGTNASGNTYGLYKYGLYVADMYGYYGLNATGTFGVYAAGGQLNYFSGNTGIGTATPNQKLEVAGVVRIDRASAPTTQYLEIGAAAGGSYINVSSASGALSLSTDGGSTPSVYISGTGLLGMRNWSSPSAAIDYGNSTGFGNGIYLFSNAAGSNAYGIQATGAGTTPSPFRTSILSNGTEVLCAAQNAGVGIGTTAPETKLEVFNTTTGSSQLLSVNDGAGSADFGLGFYVKNQGHELSSVHAYYDSSSVGGYGGLRFKTRKAGTLTDRFWIDSNGNASLGSARPNGWNANYTVLELSNYSAIANSIAGFTQIANNCYFDSVGWKTRTANPSAYMQIGTGAADFRWYSAPPALAGATPSFTNTMTLDGAGNLSVTGSMYPTATYTAIISTNSWSANTYYTVMPTGTVASGAYYVVATWDHTGGAPYVVSTAFMFTVVGTNGVGTDNAVTPACSSHTGSGTISYRAIAGTGTNSGLQLALSFAVAGNVTLRLYRFF